MIPDSAARRFDTWAMVTIIARHRVPLTEKFCLMVLTASLRCRTGAAMLKTASMTALRLWVLGSTIKYLM